MSFKHTEATKVFKALSDDNRLEIMMLLNEGEKCGCVLLSALDIGQPTLSHHMKILHDAGLVDVHKKGTWMHYSISREGATKIRGMIDRYIALPNENTSEKTDKNILENELCRTECDTIQQEKSIS